VYVIHYERRNNLLPIFLFQLIETEEDRNKMELLYINYQQLMFYVANDILKDAHKAEDAVNDAFVRAIGYLDRIGDIDCPQTRNFLVIIVKNIAINIQKRKSGSTEFYPDNDEFWQNLRDDNQNSGEIEDRYFERFELDRVRRGMKELPDAYLHTLYLKAIEGLSLEDISIIENCGIETVKKRLYRARIMLKDKLEKQQ